LDNYFYAYIHVFNGLELWLFIVYTYCAIRFFQLSSACC